MPVRVPRNGRPERRTALTRPPERRLLAMLSPSLVRPETASRPGLTVATRLFLCCACNSSDFSQ